MPAQRTAGGPVRVAVVGLGWAGRNIWLPRLADHPAFHLAAVVDPDPAARARAAAATGVMAYDDVGSLPGDKVDLAVIAVPNHLHAALATMLLAKAIPVFMEKPVCLTTAQARMLGEAEAAGGAVLLAGSAARYRADIEALRELTGSLGAIRHLDLAWTRARGIPQGRGWFTRRHLAGGGALVDLGWHLLDVGFSLIGSTAVRDVLGTVSADFLDDGAWGADWRDDAPSADEASVCGDVEDTARVFLVTDTGIGVSLRASWASHQASDLTQITLEGSAGTARLACTFGFSPDRLPRSVLTVLRGGIEEEVPLPVELVGSEYARQLDALPALLANPRMRGQGVAEAARMIGVIERLYRSARLPAGNPGSGGQVVAGQPSAGRRAEGRPPQRHPSGTARAEVATFGDIGQLRTVLADAARGECLVLHAWLAASDGARAAGCPPMLAGARLAVLDAVALAYGSGQRVVSVLEPGQAQSAGPTDHMPWLVALSRLARVVIQEDADRDELALVQRWQSRLDRRLMPPGPVSATADQIGRALAFVRSYGGDTQAIGRMVRASTFVAAPWTLAGNPGLIRTSPHGERYTVGAHAVTMRETYPVADGLASVINPLVVHTSAVAPLARVCASLDPERRDGQLLLRITVSPADLQGLGTLANIIRREGHRPAWVYACPAAPDTAQRLRAVMDILGEQQLRLAGVSLEVAGRHLELVASIAQFLMAHSSPPLRAPGSPSSTAPATLGSATAPGSFA